jgi:hypothetical protein
MHVFSRDKRLSLGREVSLWFKPNSCPQLFPQKYLMDYIHTWAAVITQGLVDFEENVWVQTN